jgi:tRNA/tmRNA/rRNA uracil-C5-methylase (TrmA/RlmC/RlmD family)
MEFSFSRTEGKTTGRSEAGMLSLGLHVRRRHHDVTELEECFLQGSYIGELVRRMRDFFRRMDADGRLSATMKPVSLVVREGKRTGEILVHLIFENGEPDFLDEFVKEIQSQEIPGKSPPQKITSLYFKHHQRKGRRNL